MDVEFRYIDINRSIIPDCRVHTLIPGDLHLGARSCRPKPLIELIDFYVGRGLERIIFQGDSFEHNSLKALPNDHQHFLDYIKKSGLEIIWLWGNHDSKLPELLSRFYGEDVSVHRDISFKHRNITYGVIHGDEFDPVMTQSGVLDKVWCFLVDVATYIHNLSQHLGDQFAAWLKRRFKGPLLNTIKHVRKGAIKHAKENNLNVIFCGHTHEPPIILTSEDEPVTYVNVSCFTEKQCGAGLITDEGAEIAYLVTHKKPLG